MGTLYLVATPIGNLEDISARALRILASVDVIAAEDTRQTQKLLNHYHIAKRPLSFHAHNEKARAAGVLEALQTGDVALVSDAGTPLVNDPGAELVRAAIQAGHPVSPIPGPSAPLAALTASGLPADAFLYLGYLPRRSKERQAALRQVRALPYTLIFLEVPHRLLDSLQDLLAVLGDRQIAAARELTKLHEQVWRGPLSAALAYFSETQPRGEFTLVVAGAPPEPTPPPAEAGLRLELAARLAQGDSAGQAAAQVAAASGVNRRRLYQMVLDIQQKAGSHEP